MQTAQKMFVSGIDKAASGVKEERNRQLQERKQDEEIKRVKHENVLVLRHLLSHTSTVVLIVKVAGMSI